MATKTLPAKKKIIKPKVLNKAKNKSKPTLGNKKIVLKKVAIKEKAQKRPWERFEEIMLPFLKDMKRDPSNLYVGEDISPIPEIKIIFEGYGYNEETGNEDDPNAEQYSFFIHKDATKKGFKFPEHELSPWSIIHRPNEERWFLVWYDVLKDSWDFVTYPDTDQEDYYLKEKDVLEILEIIDSKYSPTRRTFNKIVKPSMMLKKVTKNKPKKTVKK